MTKLYLIFLLCGLTFAFHHDYHLPGHGARGLNQLRLIGLQGQRPNRYGNLGQFRVDSHQSTSEYHANGAHGTVVDSSARIASGNSGASDDNAASSSRVAHLAISASDDNGSSSARVAHVAISASDTNDASDARDASAASAASVASASSGRSDVNNQGSPSNEANSKESNNEGSRRSFLGPHRGHYPRYLNRSPFKYPGLYAAPGRVNALNPLHSRNDATADSDASRNDLTDAKSGVHSSNSAVAQNDANVDSRGSESNDADQLGNTRSSAAAQEVDDKVDKELPNTRRFYGYPLPNNPFIPLNPYNPFNPYYSTG